METCKEFLWNCQFDDSFETQMSLNDYISSPDIGEYWEVKNVVVLVSADGDEYVIIDPENINTLYPVRVEP